MQPSRAVVSLLPFWVFPPLHAQETVAQDPVRAAVARMQALGRPGLCFVRPRSRADAGGVLDEAAQKRLRADFRERLRANGVVLGKLADAMVAEVTPLASVDDQFATLLHRLLLTQDPRALLLLVEPVLLAADAAAIGARPDENLVLIGADGRRIAGARIDLRDDGSFVRGAEALLQAARKPLPRARQERLQEALALATSAEAGQRALAVQKLAADPGDAVPALQRALATAKESERAPLAEVATQVAQGLAGVDRAALLPFGADWLDDASTIDPCPPCGMAMVSASARRMLRLQAR
jgi:hypothetical protein